jgi:hypothetical protein
MDDPATLLFLKTYRATRCLQVAMLELKRVGWDQQQTAAVLGRLFCIDHLLAQKVVRDSLAWQH